MGEDDELDAVTGRELLEQMAHVGLDRRGGQPGEAWITSPFATSLLMVGVVLLSAGAHAAPVVLVPDRQADPVEVAEQGQRDAP